MAAVRAGIGARWVGLLAVLGGAAATAADGGPAAPPPDLRVTPVPGRLGVDRFYAKHVSVGGLPVLGSAKVSDFALAEAAHLVEQMLRDRADLRDALIAAGVRVAVMAPDEFTTDIPEHRDLTPRDRWDKRARGLGATRRRPAVSCGEENLLGLRGDPYAGESILIHEFAHTLHGIALAAAEPDFDGRLDRAFRAATARGLWAGTYAATNRGEYWAEGVQSYFGANRTGDRSHNRINSRRDLAEYDPDLAALIAGVFRGAEWTYVPPARRTAKGHLEGLDADRLPRFQWPERLRGDPAGPPGTRQ